MNIKTILWDSSKEESSSSISGFTQIWPYNKQHTKDINRQLQLLQFCPEFQKELSDFRKEFNLSSHVDSISVKEIENKNHVFHLIEKLSCSKDIYRQAASFSEKYMKGEQHFSFAIFVVFNIFPIEQTLLDICYYRKEKDGESISFIELKRNIGIREFTKQAIILWQEIKGLTEDVKSHKFPSMRDDVFQMMCRIYELRSALCPYKQIQEILTQEQGVEIDIPYIKRLYMQAKERLGLSVPKKSKSRSRDKF